MGLGETQRARTVSAADLKAADFELCFSCLVMVTVLLPALLLNVKPIPSNVEPVESSQMTAIPLITNFCGICHSWAGIPMATQGAQVGCLILGS